MAYHTYVASVLSFVAQLEMPPPTVLACEEWALRTAAGGPGNWVCPADLWYLHVHFGMPHLFSCLRTKAESAQVRVAMWMARAAGDLPLQRWRRELKQAKHDTIRIQRLGE